jgi:EAL domain-containing protein (putative c-di-GMP-specific phosphodiesterase class I)/CheY-like chemotaxis protein
MKVLVADDDKAYRDLLASIVELEPSLTLVGVAEDAEQAIRLAGQVSPDVVLLDVQMPERGGVHATKEIRRACPQARIVALSGTRERRQVISMLRAGAVGYLLKTSTPSEILRMLTGARRDNVTMSRAAATNFLTQAESGPSREEVELIRSLLDGDRINLVLQPILDLEADAIAGYEVLSRFAVAPKSPPDAWFRRADEAGLRVDLELTVLAKALKLTNSIPEGRYLAINLSPEAAMSERCAAALRDSQPDRIVIELTEHLPVSEYLPLRDRLADLRSMGVGISIDDVGAGFASLRHILELSPDFIKLDISLTRHIDQDTPRRALATALIYFAAELDAAVIAEGVETKAELRALAALGVGFAQGFYLGRPAPFVVPSPVVAREKELMDGAVVDMRVAKTASDAIDALAERLAPHLPLARVSLRVFVPPNHVSLVAVWSTGETSLKPGTSTSALATSFPEVVRCDGPVCSSDPFVYHPIVEQVLSAEGIESWMCLPLHGPDGSVAGMLTFGSTEPDVFDGATVAALARIGVAVERPLLAFAPS